MSQLYIQTMVDLTGYEPISYTIPAQATAAAVDFFTL
jgi:hypothetical protein